MTLDSSGAKVAETRYDVWGKPFWQDAPMHTNRLYTGQLWDGKVADSGTGLYFYNARYYDPALGRFTQADTIVPTPGNPQSLNRFSYVLNNPLRYTDPSGHWSQEQLDQYLGDGWEDTYFGKGAVFAGQDWLKSILLSDQLTDEFILEHMVAPALKGFNESFQSGDFFDLTGIDALGFRVEASITKAIFGANFEIDLIFNIKAEEFSIFVVPAGGFAHPKGRSVTGGFIAIWNLESNGQFRGPGWSGGLFQGFFGGGYGANGEGFFGTLDDSYDPRNVPHGISVGGGRTWDNSFLFAGGYAWEVLRVDYSGPQWQMPTHIFDGTQPWPSGALGEMWNAFIHDFIQNPNIPF